MERGSYRDISVTPVLSKLLEILILLRLEPYLQELGILHTNQTGYRRHTSCADAIFSTAKRMAHYLKQREIIYLCCYDLQKTFDSVEYGVLLCRLYDEGINAKLWRLLRAWYLAPKCQVQLNSTLSNQFSLQRGVRQGLVHSPILFLLVMDPLLREMESLHLGPSFAGLYLGASAHADDVRTLTSSLLCLKQQVDLVQDFASRNDLLLNIQKCEVMAASSACNTGSVLCSLDRMFEACIVPILLYGYENWVPTTSLLTPVGTVSRRDCEENSEGVKESLSPLMQDSTAVAISCSTGLC